MRCKQIASNSPLRVEEKGVNNIHGLIRLEVGDNGQGFDREDFKESKTLGLHYSKEITPAAAGEYEINTDGGFELAFTFESRQKRSHANI